jgi:hypothetical protein
MIAEKMNDFCSLQEDTLNTIYQKFARLIDYFDFVCGVICCQDVHKSSRDINFPNFGSFRPQFLILPVVFNYPSLNILKST